MKRAQVPAAVVLAALLFAGIGWAGDAMMQGQDSSNVVRYVAVDSSGRLLTTTSSSGSGTSGATHTACTQTAVTVGTSATNVPASPIANRSSIAIQMRTSGQTLSCVLGSTATTANAIDLGNFDILKDNLASSVNANCVCSAAGCDVRVTECP